MADEYRKHDSVPQDLKRRFKEIATDPATGEPIYAEVMALEPASIGGGGAGGGIQYTEGEADATITGTAAMWEDASNTLRPVSADKPLPVAVITGGGGGGAGTEYTEGAIDATITGTALMWEDAADTLMPVSAAKPLPVDLQDATVAVTDNNGSLTVDGSVSVSNFPATQPVSGTVAVSNHPTTTEVSNFPAVQPVSDNNGSLTVDGTVAVSNFPASQAVTGPLTDTQLRATAVPVSGFPAVQPVSDNNGSLTVDGPVTDAEIRATPLPVSGTVTANVGTGTQPVSGTVSINSIPAGTNNIGDVDVLTLPALPAGTNNIGDVDVLSIAAGDNNIGNVDVVTLPALPAGTNNIGDVDVLSLPALPAGTNNIGDVDVLTLPALPAGNNNIGDVDVATLPSLPAGTNNIGRIEVYSGANPVGVVLPNNDAVPPATSIALQTQAFGMEFNGTNWQRARTFAVGSHRRASTAELTLGTAVAINRILCIWHPAAETKTAYINKVTLYFKAKHTVGVGQYKMAFVTAESATGTLLNIAVTNRAATLSSISVRSAPTAHTFEATVRPMVNYTSSLAAITGNVQDSMVALYTGERDKHERITLRGGVAEGMLIYQDVTATLTTAPIVACEIEWEEV